MSRTMTSRTVRLACAALVAVFVGGWPVEAGRSINCPCGHFLSARRPKPLRVEGVGLVMLNLRGSELNCVEQAGTTQMRGIWEWTALFADDPQLGLVRFTYNIPNKKSLVTVVSNSPTGEPFFPAHVTHELFWIIDLPKLGKRVFNKDPVLLQADVTAIPPIGVTFQLVRPVDFFDVDDPDVRLATMELPDEAEIFASNGIRVSNTQLSVDAAGAFTGTWEISNETDEPLDVMWMAFATKGTDVSPSMASDPIRVAPGSPVSIALAGKLPEAGTSGVVHIINGAELDNFVSFHAVSVRGRPAEGQTQTELKPDTVIGQRR